MIFDSYKVNGEGHLLRKNCSLFCNFRGHLLGTVDHMFFVLILCVIQVISRLALRAGFLIASVTDLCILFPFSFLAHLSQRLTGELIGYPWIRHPSVHIFKHLLL